MFFWFWNLGLWNFCYFVTFINEFRTIIKVTCSGVTSSRAPGGKMLLSRPPPPLRFNFECFYSIVNHQIQRVRSAVNISSIWWFCLIRAWTQWRTEGFWRLGRRWGLAPLPSECQTGKRKGALPRYWGGSGAEPQPPTLLGLGSNWEWMEPIFE